MFVRGHPSVEKEQRIWNLKGALAAPIIGRSPPRYRLLPQLWELSRTKCPQIHGPKMVKSSITQPPIVRLRWSLVWAHYGSAIVAEYSILLRRNYSPTWLVRRQAVSSCNASQLSPYQIKSNQIQSKGGLVCLAVRKVDCTGETTICIMFFTY